MTEAWQDSVEDLPEDTLLFLLGSRYCETDLLSQTAWQLFGGAAPGYPRVRAICDYVHNHIVFNYQNARPTRSASEAFHERAGVCRDYAHLAIAFCRCMNIPARYCTGYLGDVGTAAFPTGRFRRVVRGLDRRPLAHFRPAQQCAPDEPRPDGERPRRLRRRDRHYVRSQLPGRFQGLDRRDPGIEDCVTEVDG